MWFMFGFISLFGFMAASLHLRLAARWHGTVAFTSGQRSEYEILEQRSKDAKLVGLRLGVTAPAGYDFSFKPEKWGDWVPKRVGFSVEYHTGDAEFDKAIYILSNDARIHTTLNRNAALRAYILRMFMSIAPPSAVLKEIRCSGGRVWVHYKLKTEINSAEISALAEEVVPVLNKLVAELCHITLVGAPKPHDRFVLRAAIILAISTGLAANGAVHLVRLVLIPIPFNVDNATLMAWSLYCGAVLLILLVFAVVRFLGRSARAHVVLFEVLLVGSVGAVLTSFVELRDLNMGWDQQAAVRYEVSAVSKRISRGKGSKKSYYVTISGWPNKNDTNELKVSSSLYHRTDLGGEMDLFQKPGFLNIPWVEAVTPRETGQVQ